MSSLSGTPVGRVTFKNGSAFLGSATLTAGVAIITTAVVGAGTRSITAVYNGTAAFTGSTSSVLSQVVDQAATTTALTSSQNPSTYGQSVTFIATVSSSYAGTPSGKVTFKVGKTVLGSGSLSGGAASYTTSVTQLAGGTTSVIATYSGGVNFSGSTSGAYSQTVSPAPTTNVLTSSLNPANTGQGVTLTTTLNSTAGTPSGNVEFLDGTTTIGVVALKSGSAQLGTSFITTGTHDLSANYLGNANYAVSMAPYSELVNLGQNQGNQIDHVVIIFQENRTPDNLFQGLPGADIATSGVNSAGQVIALQQTSMVQSWDLGHSHNDFVAMYDNGLMDGADLISVGCTGTTAGCPPNPQFQYVDPTEVAPYFQLAEQYTFGDRMFQSNQGPSYPAHQYIIAGTSVPSVGGAYGSYFVAETPRPKGPTGCVNAASTQTVALIDPTGVESASIYPCFDHPTLIDLLDPAGISWRYYSSTLYSIWVGPNSIEHLRTGPDWNNVINSSSQVLTDIANGNLAQVVWVIPTGPESDHAMVTDGSGPYWVASIVNAIGSSAYWSNTAIIITWDDWGGWYDHVAPTILNSYQYGFRVPLIVVSPYAKQGYVSHVTHDFGSILHFIESTFNLPSLGYADALADDLSDCFDFSQSPSAYKAIASKYGAAYFIERGKTVPATDPDDD